MRIDVTNSWFDPKKVENAAKFFLNKILKKKLIKDQLDIEIAFLEKLPIGWEEFDAYIHNDDEYNDPSLYFTISFQRNNRDWEHFLRVLAHELVHVKQYALHELKETPKGVKWKGKFYSDSFIEKNYENLPWEIEAFDEEGYLYDAYNV